ncbi:MAG: ABC transporter ATP-binding protein [Endomicrobiales bacterium]|nr:ABC transporter ATP-binding protein [Endomicrobiales bacterium]
MIFKRLLSYLRPHVPRFIVSMLCMAVFSALTGATMWIIKNIFDRIFVAKDVQMLYLITWLIPVLFIVKGIAGYGQNYLLYFITQNVVLKIRNELYEKLISLSHDFYSKNSTARLMARVTNDVMALQLALFRVPPAIIRDGLTVLVMIVILFYLHWKFAIISLLIFPIAAVPIAQFSRKMRQASREGQKQMGEIYAALQETLHGMTVIKAFMREADEVARFHKENDEFYHTQQRFIRVDARSSPIMEFIGSLAVAFILWYGGKDVIDGVWTSGSFVAFLTAAFSLYQPLKNFSQTNSYIQLAVAGTERIFEIIDEKPTIVETQNPQEAGDFKDKITFEGVTFHYPEKNDVIKNLNLEIKKGQAVALVGPSGSGKTSLASLLLRFYEAQSGAIRIDGIDVKEMKITSLRSLVGIVPQETLLFNETVKYNVAYGKRDASEEEVSAALKAANANNFISRLPKGMDTYIGERGVRISGGERQRLAIARAILKNPPILVLDEATSSLDAESEKLVQEAIEKLMQNRTVIMIAHRLATVKKADRIIVLDKGVIVEDGTHEQLLEREGIYHRLHSLQLL